ncbi:hypothetical protein VSDG_08934 [Cytospora chrysosperma]|uniref:Uncharacterized protein n=1 Tax=Cytospora chrysosperma TaxID=252740 RepID=A0A423VD44_CYTCH|nr:hypothetical protein VSDG_08934 [Valsa sordida]
MSLSAPFLPIPRSVVAGRAAAIAKAAADASGLGPVGELISRLRVFSTCDVGDALIRLGDKRAGILHGINLRTPAATNGTSPKICGPAVTVRMSNYGGALGRAMKPMVEYNERGKVMVIETPDGKAGKVSACWGALESARAKVLRAEGVIVSGNMRQVSDCHKIGFPVFSRGTAMLGTRQFMRLAKINDRISISGVDIHAGDIVLADEHGAVVVRRKRLQEVIDLCEYGAKHDKMVMEAINKGATMREATQHARMELGPHPLEIVGPHEP